MRPGYLEFCFQKTPNLCRTPNSWPFPPYCTIWFDRPLHGEERFEVDGANAARAFMKERGISTQQTQVVWDAIALHTTRSIALHKEPEVAMTHSGIAVDAIGLVSIEFRQTNNARFSRSFLA